MEGKGNIRKQKNKPILHINAVTIMGVVILRFFFSSNIINLDEQKDSKKCDIILNLFPKST